jgi:hypothetical protein
VTDRRGGKQEKDLADWRAMPASRLDGAALAIQDETEVAGCKHEARVPGRTIDLTASGRLRTVEADAQKAHFGSPDCGRSVAACGGGLPHAGRSACTVDGMLRADDLPGRSPEPGMLFSPASDRRFAVASRIAYISCCANDGTY